jgi:cystathionine beta-lyase/cystathionine gamma-synthase
MQPLIPPVSLCSAWSAGSADDLAGYHADKMEGQRYGRDSSDTVLECERALEAVNGGPLKALAFGSGMSATSAVLDVLMEPGRTICVPNEHYRKLRELAGSRWPTATEYDDVGDIDPADRMVIWIESPSNPHLRLADYRALAMLRRACPDILIVADFTFSGLANWQGDWSMFDCVVHSATKYISGHNDLIAGVVFARPDLHKRIWERRSYAGGILDPMSAWLLMRSLKTYEVRIVRQVHNTKAVIVELYSRGLSIFYPGAHRNAGERTRADFHRHGGSVVSFEVPGVSPDELTDRIGSCETIRMAPSFGSVDSLAECPATMSHAGKSAEELRAMGLEPSLVRLSVGLEPYDRIISDVRRIVTG